MKAKLKMEDGKLIIEGLSIDVDGNIELECSEEDLKELIENKLAKLKKTGYEKRLEHEKYYFDYCGSASEAWGMATDYYEAADYYSDKTVAENNARADKLMRQLRRFAVEHRKRDIDWYEPGCRYYAIVYYHHTTEPLSYNINETVQEFSSIYFDSVYAVKSAIETFYDELIWYFTEYKDSL